MKTTAILGPLLSAMTWAATHSVPLLLVIVAMVIFIAGFLYVVSGDDQRTTNLSHLLRGPNTPAKRKRKPK